MREYWIVDPVDDTILVQSLEGDRYMTTGTFGRDAVLQTQLLPELRLEITKVFSDTPAEIPRAVDRSAEE